MCVPFEFEDISVLLPAPWFVCLCIGLYHFVASECDGGSSYLLCTLLWCQCDNRPLCLPRTYGRKLSLLEVTNWSSVHICPNKEAYLYLFMLYLLFVSA